MKREIFTRIVTLGRAEWTVEVTRKTVKNLRMAVTRDGNVRLSAPMRCPVSQIDAFLANNLSWIAKATEKQQKTNAQRAESAKEHIRILGKEYCYEILQGEDTVQVTDDKVSIYCADGQRDLAKQCFDRWWDEQAREFLTAEFTHSYETIFMDRYLPRPDLQVKRAKSYWGNCRKDKNLIRLNAYLYQAEEDCIRYVILHELCHLYHPNHGKQFHKLLFSICPNAPILRKKLLQTTQTNLWTDF